MKFSRNLRRVIQEDGRNQRDLAAAAGITPVTLSRWLNGSREPRKPELQRLAQVLNVEVEAITDNELTDIDGLTIEEWRERALSAEAKLEEMSSGTFTPPEKDDITAEEYLARLRESMRFVFHFITEDAQFKNKR